MPNPKDEKIVHCVIEATYLEEMQPEPLKVDAKQLLKKFIAKRLRSISNSTKINPRPNKPS